MIDNTRGILAMSAAVFVFIFNDALIKIAAETVPAIQAIGVPGVFPGRFRTPLDQRRVQHPHGIRGSVLGHQGR